MQTPLSYLEIDTEALRANVRALRSELKGGQKVAGVIKANAYGHGDTLVAKALETEVDYFQIDDIEEWRRIRLVTQKPILLLGYVQTEEARELLGTETELAVFSMEQLRELASLSQDQPLKIHLTFDCLLGREGFLPIEAGDVISFLKSAPSLKLSGVYAHFANVEDTTDQTHAVNQVTTLTEIVEAFLDAGFSQFEVHHSSTAGSMIFEDTRETITTLARLGVGLYGYWPADHLKTASHLTKVSLTPALRWISHVAQVKTIPAGQSIGYGRTHVTDKDTVIALIPQGYSDGFDRGLSGKGHVLIAGEKRAVLGRVSMNMLVVDVTGSSVARGDEVVLIGQQGNASITATDIANEISTIDYEILARLSPLLPRIAT